MKPMSMRMVRALGVTLVAAGVWGQAHALDISGAGATFPQPVYQAWAQAYKDKTGTSLNYQGIGSSGGIKQIQAKTVDFGASDLPLAPEKLQEAGLVQWPQIIGGIVPVLNLKGIQPGQLKLTGPVLAEIMMGKITKWNDPAITKLNAGLALPDQQIAVVYRSDGSGTTYNFSHYLADVSPEWKEKIGVNTTLQWPTGQGAKGNPGVAATVGQLEGGIGYVEYAFVKQNKLTYALVQNQAGEYPQPSAEAFQAAASNAKWKDAPGFYLFLTNQPGKNSWPISASSFILMHRVQEKPETGTEVLKFFDWAFHQGDKIALNLDYVPIPQNVVKIIEGEHWFTMKAANTGNPVWTGKAG